MSTMYNDYGADHGFQGVREDRGLVPPAGTVLAPAKPHVVAELEPARTQRLQPAALALFTNDNSAIFIDQILLLVLFGS